MNDRAYPGQSHKTAEEVIARLRDFDVPATPENFAVWYAYETAQMPELVRGIDILTQNNRAITEETCRDLYDLYFNRLDGTEELIRTGEEMTRSAGKVAKVLQGAGADATAYKTALEDFRGRISDVEENIPETYSDILHHTQEMQRQNDLLREQLAQSSDEINRLREDLETVRNEAITDGLTGVGNRKFFDIMLRKFADDAAKTGQPACLLLYDVDHFKAFNDKHGHQIGDQVLRLVARTLKEAVKGGDIVARYGGEEFAIILPKTVLNDALTVADQVRSLVSQRRLVRKRTGEEVAAITISAGVALYRPGENLSDWVDRTDAALYKAKQLGRNRVEAEEPAREFAVNQ